MAESADNWIDRLWTRLGLGSRRVGEVDSLDVDGLSVRIRPSDSERSIVVEADGGMLPADGVARSRAIRRLLTVNLGMLTTNAAGISLVDAGANRTAVRVMATWPLGSGGLDGLIAIIDDVVYRAEFHRRDLDNESAPRKPVALTGGSEDFEERFIFRP